MSVLQITSSSYSYCERFVFVQNLKKSISSAFERKSKYQSGQCATKHQNFPSKYFDCYKTIYKFFLKRLTKFWIFKKKINENNKKIKIKNKK